MLVFPPRIDLFFVVGMLALALAIAGWAGAERLRGSAIGRTVVTIRLPAAVVGLVLTVSSFFAATPESQLANPVPRTVESIAIGARVYANNCATCHGIDARGGGPLSATTPVPPPPLSGPGSHLGDHTDGDLHYWIANGLPGGMPAWAGTLTDDEIWHVINHLRSLQEGDR